MLRKILTVPLELWPKGKNTNMYTRYSRTIFIYLFVYLPSVQKELSQKYIQKRRIVHLGNLRPSSDAELFMSRTGPAQITKIPSFDSDAELNSLDAKKIEMSALFR